MKTNEENRGISDWMCCQSTSIDLSGSETYLFPVLSMETDTLKGWFFLNGLRLYREIYLKDVQN